MSPERVALRRVFELERSPTATDLLFFGFLLSGAPLEIRDDARVSERRGIAELAILGDVAEQAAHDLSASSFGQIWRERDPLGLGDRADQLGDVVAQLGDELGRLLEARSKRHERRDGLPGLGV